MVNTTNMQLVESLPVVKLAQLDFTPISSLKLKNAEY